MPQDSSSILNSNSLLILNHVLDNPSVSRTQISNELNLPKTVVSDNVKKLIFRGLISEGKPVKRQIPLFVDPNNVYNLFVNVTEDYTSTDMFTLGGDLVKSERLLPYKKFSKTEFLNSLVKSCFRAIKLADNRVINIYLAIPSNIDSEYVKKVLSSNLNINVQVYDSSSIVKEYINKKVSYRSFNYVNLNEEGLSLIQVHEGAIISNSDLFGHLKVGNTGICKCGQIGCLNTYFSANSINEDSSNALAKAINTSFKITNCPNFIIGGSLVTLLDNYKNTIITLSKNLNVLFLDKSLVEYMKLLNS